ncbi:MAG TPA: NAD/NADP octopine/nopaline dehydrogenase family protein [Anaerolineae bacterium]|nr:NAD/NADP octopine/nopaline dehydrogenase family protein [Anaerolineae bacterium]
MSGDTPRFAVLGTGNSGHAFAADIALKGFSVNMADVPAFKANLDAIEEKGGIEISGKASEGFAKLNLVTTDVEKAIKGVDIIILGAPANAHEPYSRALASYLEDDQFVVFISNFGALRFHHWMRELGVKANVVPVETQSLIYATRSPEPGSVEVFGIKSELGAAALPASRTAEFLEKISVIFPQWNAAENVLYTSFNNMNPIVHPPMTLLNTGRIESTMGKGWNLYGDGATQSVAQVMEATDGERMSLAELCGVSSVSIKDSFTSMYKHLGIHADTLSQVLRNSPIHANPALPGTPSSMKTRYVTEDVPFGMVPWSSMGHMWGVPTPTCDALIQLASVIEGVNYFEKGVTVRDMGIEGLSPQQVRELVE